MGLPPWAVSTSQRFILVTGANSGLGFSICQRLLDEFLSSPSRDPTSHLVLIVTTRSPLKTRFTITRLRHHLRHLAEHSSFASVLRKQAKQQGKAYDWRDLVTRVHFLGVELDLCDLRQVYDAARKIRGEGGGIGSPDLLTSEGLRRDDGKGVGLRNIRIPRLDVLVMNAGIGGWSGLDWPTAAWTVITNMPESVTWPVFKRAYIGAKVKKQGGLTGNRAGYGDGESTQKLPSGNGHLEYHNDDAEPTLGEVFCANVFGHYVLGHELMPLLSNTEGRTNGDRGRLVWISSIEALPESLDEDDLQGLQSSIPYESSKRLIDILSLTAELPSVRKISAPYFEVSSTNAAAEDESAEEKCLWRPEMYLTHPGVCATDIIALNIVLQWAMTLAFYIARWIGSVWHPVTSYKGACAPVWIALEEQRTLDSLEGVDSRDGSGNGKVKWGSSTDRWGEERARKTEVGLWGWNGVVGESDVQERRGRKKDAADLTREAREEFEALGGRCWKEMEQLRREWEERLSLRRE